MEFLFLCQREVCFNLNGHPVDIYLEVLAPGFCGEVVLDGGGLDLGELPAAAVRLVARVGAGAHAAPLVTPVPIGVSA